MSTSKRKKELRQKQMQAAAAQARYEATISKPKKKEFKEYVPTDTYRRETPEYASLKTTMCDTAKSEQQRYTGDYITGITIVHKSGLAPISRGIDPKDYATMRR